MNIEAQVAVRDAIHSVVANNGLIVLDPTRDNRSNCTFFAVVGYKNNHQYAVIIPFSDMEVESLKVCPSYLAKLRAAKALQTLHREMAK